MGDGFVGGGNAPVLAGPIATVARVQRVAALLADMDDPDAAWFADAARLWLAGAPWDASLGLHDGWRAHLAGRTQQAALAALVAAQPAGLSCLALAIRIAEPLLRYETTAWPRDRDAGRRPSGPDGLLYDLLLTDCPRSVSRLRRVLKELGIIG